VPQFWLFSKRCQRASIIADAEEPRNPKSLADGSVRNLMRNKAAWRAANPADDEASAAGADELRFSLDVSLELIQSIRMAQALAEAGCRLHIEPADEPKFARLAEIFAMAYEIGLDGAPPLPGLTIDHALPETRVGRVSRSLIFPHAAFEYCRERWASRRRHEVSFAGLATESRRRVINDWLRRSGRDGLTLVNSKSIINRIPSKIATILRGSATWKASRGDITLWSSNRGRVFPIKSWDDQYFDLLLTSKFVLCPTGVHIWSYRFFEAAMCGAIPIIEQNCPAFHGFRFLTIDEPFESASWSHADADHNFELAHHRLTVPRSDLRSEVARLLRPAGAWADSSGRGPGLDETGELACLTVETDAGD
jgi:hypothetical protein